MASPDGLVNLGKRDSIASIGRDNLASDHVEFTAGLGAGADEDGLVGRLVDLEAPLLLGAVGVGKVAGPLTNNGCEGGTF